MSTQDTFHRIIAAHRKLAADALHDGDTEKVTDPEITPQVMIELFQLAVIARDESNFVAMNEALDLGIGWLTHARNVLAETQPEMLAEYFAKARDAADRIQQPSTISVQGTALTDAELRELDLEDTPRESP